MEENITQKQTRIDDELVVIRCQLGERLAFDALIERWADPVTVFARRVSRDADAATDLTQDIWLRVIRGISGVRDTGRFRSWLFAVAHRAFVDSLRGQYARLATTNDEIDLAAVDDSTDEHADLDRMETALICLPPIEREILTLFYLQEQSVNDVAHALAVPTGTVKSRLHRARKLLRQAFEKGVSYE